jgi:ABC-2 type transport system ATP-binding protein
MKHPNRQIRMTPDLTNARRRRTTPPALELDGLTKAFGSTVAADGVDLVVPAGSFFGLVGPNGAGKTTSLSMAVGLLRPDSGTSRVFGVTCGRSRFQPSRCSACCPTA